MSIDSGWGPDFDGGPSADSHLVGFGVCRPERTSHVSLVDHAAACAPAISDVYGRIGALAHVGMAYARVRLLARSEAMAKTNPHHPHCRAGRRARPVGCQFRIPLFAGIIKTNRCGISLCRARTGSWTCDLVAFGNPVSATRPAHTR
jgi:hypothetical protein